MPDNLQLLTFSKLFAILLIAVGSAALNQLQQMNSLFKVTIPAGIIVYVHFLFLFHRDSLGVFMLLVPILGFVGTLKQQKGVMVAVCNEDFTTSYFILVCSHLASLHYL